MSSDPSHNRSEDSALRADAGAGADDAEGAARAGSRRRPSKTRRAPRPGRDKSAGAQAEEHAPDDAGERLREHAAEILSATRDRIVARPLQAVLVAAAAGAFAALLLGSGRR